LRQGPNLRVGHREPIKILVAEDDRAFRALLAETLRHPDREIHLAANGKEALEALREVSYDLLITDIRMPEMGGIELLKEAKRLCPHILVIVITGYASLETAIQALKEGAYDYIRKPFNLEELRVSVENACIRILLERENRRLLNDLKEAYTRLREFSSERVAVVPPTDFLAELERLARLRKEGFLAEDEYQTLKKILLERVR